jgi:hypothetical protein
MAVPRMPFSYWYNLLIPSIEGLGRIPKSVVTMAMFWLAHGKVGGSVPPWLMVMAMALARPRALV